MLETTLDEAYLKLKGEAELMCSNFAKNITEAGGNKLFPLHDGRLSADVFTRADGSWTIIWNKPLENDHDFTFFREYATDVVARGEKDLYRRSFFREFCMPVYELAIETEKRFVEIRRLGAFNRKLKKEVKLHLSRVQRKLSS